VGDGAKGATFIGRKAELARLEQALARVGTEAGATIIVGGEAGIGKTWLLDHFAAIARTDGGQVLSGACLEFGGRGVPFAPFVEALRSLVRSVEPARLPALLGPARRGLAPLLPDLDSSFAARDDAPAERDRAGQARLFELVLDVVERISRSTPLVLIVEDIQWADDDTRDLIAFLVRHLRSSDVLTILSVRTDDRDRDDRWLRFLAELERDPWVERIELGSFDRRDLGRLLEARSDRAVPAELVDEILARSGGNPFYAEQLLAINRADDDGGTLPQRLQDVLEARLAALPPTALDVVRAAAVAAGRVDDAALQAVLGIPARALTDALRAAIDDAVLISIHGADGEIGGYAFRHALLREVAYGNLLPGERVRLHASFAAFFQARRDAGVSIDPSELAFQLDGAREFARVVPVLVEAGEAAERAFAFGRAGRLYERALELWDAAGKAHGAPTTDRAEVTQRAAECALLTGAHHRAIELSRMAISLLELAVPPDAIRLGRLGDRLRWFLWESGDRGAASAAVDEALATIPIDPPSAARARALGQAAGVRMEAGDLGRAMAFARDSITMARAVGAASEEAFAGGILGWCEAMSGNVATGITTYRAALAIAKRLGGAEGISLGYANLAVLLDRLGRSEEALTVAMEGFGEVRDLGVSRTYGGVLLGHAATALFDLGRWREATVIAGEGLDLDPIGRSATELQLACARIASNQGRLDEAASYLRRANELTESSGGTTAYSPALLAAEADLAREEGRYRDVRAALERGVEFVADDRPLDPGLGWLAATGLRTEADAAQIARARHDQPGLMLATAIADGITAFVERASSGPAIAADVRRDAMLALCHAERHRVDGPGDGLDWADVAKRWDALGRPYPAAYARYRLGEAIIGSKGSRAEAAAALGEAMTVANTLEAGPLRTAILDLARHARLTVVTGPLAIESASRDDLPDRGNQQGLTGRESEIIRLVAAGWSNQQIADALFITRKTASVHVSNILGKLGVRNRVEAAAVAQRLGIGEDVPIATGGGRRRGA